MLLSREHAQFLQQYPLLATIGNTPLVRVDVLEEEFPDLTVSAKLEYFNPGGSLKDRPVRQILLDALATGALRPGKIILDSSSGNAGIAYAMLGAVLKYPVHLVVPENASLERRKRIVAHGAKLITTDALKGYDEALREVHRLAERESERYFFADQYSNASNWQAHYYGTAAEILEQTGGQLTHFVGGIGTGGAITGIGRRLKEYNPNIQVVAIIPEEFPGVEGLKPWAVRMRLYRLFLTKASLIIASTCPWSRRMTCAGASPEPAFLSVSPPAPICRESIRSPRWCDLATSSLCLTISVSAMPARICGSAMARRDSDAPDPYSVSVENMRSREPPRYPMVTL
jgi:cysteine synthase B